MKQAIVFMGIVAIVLVLKAIYGCLRTLYKQFSQLLSRAHFYCWNQANSISKESLSCQFLQRVCCLHLLTARSTH